MDRDQRGTNAMRPERRAPRTVIAAAVAAALLALSACGEASSACGEAGRLDTM